MAVAAVLVAVYLFATRAAIWGVPVEVVSVTDGDTIKVLYRGRVEPVRLLGMGVRLTPKSQQDTGSNSIDQLSLTLESEA